MKYKWNSRKTSRKQHLCTDDGLTYCKAENGSWIFDTLSDSADPHRNVCSICLHMKAKEDAQRNGEKLKKQGLKGKKKAAKGSATNKRRRDIFLHTREWRAVRYEVLRRNDGRCELCGRGKSDGVVLNVDHIKARIKYPELALTYSNLQVLCSACNQGKGNWDETDWREPDVRVLMGEKAA